MLRDNTIILMNCIGLDRTYNNTYMFKNKQNQYNYFLSKRVITINDTVFNKRNNSFIIEKYIYDPQLELCNYCMFLNENNKPEYYFIVDKIYKSDESTQILVELDVFQTFIFDVGLLNTSYVDRYHQPTHYNRIDGRKLNKNIFYEDEGLDVGEYRVKNIYNIYDYRNKGIYIATSSTCLTTPVGGGQGSQPSYANGEILLWKKGLVSDFGFVFIKSYEAFSSVPYNIGDGTNTIGYGTTQKYDTGNYNKLLPRCTEQQASEVFSYTLDNNYCKYVYDKLVSSGKNLENVKQNHFDAFCSFYYNTGELTNKEIWTMYVNEEDESKIYEAWLETNIRKGTKFEQGLRNRRRAEAEIFKNHIYEQRQIQNLEGGYVTDNNGMGYIPNQYIVIAKMPSTIREEIVNKAKSLIGKPYRYGGNYPPLGNSDGTDCSGLCQWAYNEVGIKISRTTYTQIKEGKLITQEQARQGDLVFTRGYGDNGHVVMFLSDNGDGTIEVIEAKETGTDIMYNTRKVNNQYMFRNLIGD